MNLVRALSLDVVLGGLCGGALAVFVTGAAMPATWWYVLPAAIWVVYTLDHLVDAVRVGPGAENQRHRMHARFMKPLLAAVVVVGFATAAISFATLPRSVLLAGAMGGVAIGLHLLGARFGFPRWAPKELSVTVIYTGGIWCAPLLLAPWFDRWAWGALELHALAAFVYLLLYALFESPVDSADRSPSLARSSGGGTVEVAMTTLSIMGALVAAGIAWTAPDAMRPAFAALAVLLIAPLVVTGFRSWFGRDERFRYAEFVFLVLAVPFLLG